MDPTTVMNVIDAESHLSTTYQAFLKDHGWQWQRNRWQLQTPEGTYIAFDIKTAVETQKRIIKEARK